MVTSLSPGGTEPVPTFAGPQDAPGCQAGTGNANMGRAARSHRLPEFLGTRLLVPHPVCVTGWTNASLSPPPDPELTAGLVRGVEETPALL